MAAAAHELLQYCAVNPGAKGVEWSLALDLWRQVQWDDGAVKVLRGDVQTVLIPLYRQLCACLPAHKPVFGTLVTLLGHAVEHGLVEGDPAACAAQLLRDLRSLCPRCCTLENGAFLTSVVSQVALPIFCKDTSKTSLEASAEPSSEAVALRKDLSSAALELLQVRDGGVGWGGLGWEWGVVWCGGVGWDTCGPSTQRGLPFLFASCSHLSPGHRFVQHLSPPAHREQVALCCHF